MSPDAQSRNGAGLAPAGMVRRQRPGVGGPAPMFFSSTTALGTATARQRCEGVNAGAARVAPDVAESSMSHESHGALHL
jgi:hypothetical protein